MRQYKHLFIPPRHKRTDENINDVRQNYCLKTKCGGTGVGCLECLFSEENIKLFREWYLNKNKTTPKEQRGDIVAKIEFETITITLSEDEAYPFYEALCLYNLNKGEPRPKIVLPEIILKMQQSFGFGYSLDLTGACMKQINQEQEKEQYGGR